MMKLRWNSDGTQMNSDESEKKLRWNSDETQMKLRWNSDETQMKFNSDTKLWTLNSEINLGHKIQTTATLPLTPPLAQV